MDPFFQAQRRDQVARKRWASGLKRGSVKVSVIPDEATCTGIGAGHYRGRGQDDGINQWREWSHAPLLVLVSGQELLQPAPRGVDHFLGKDLLCAGYFSADLA